MNKFRRLILEAFLNEMPHSPDLGFDWGFEGFQKQQNPEGMKKYLGAILQGKEVQSMAKKYEEPPIIQLKNAHELSIATRELLDPFPFDENNFYKQFGWEWGEYLHFIRSMSNNSPLKDIVP